VKKSESVSERELDRNSKFMTLAFVKQSYVLKREREIEREKE
jgi:hypothetical protein